MRRSLVFFLLFSLFLLVFVLSPLWTRFPGLPARAAALAASLLAGLAWAWWSSGALRLATGRRALLLHALPLLVLIPLAALLNAEALSAPIPWRGDEDNHIAFTWDIARALASRPWYLAAVLPVAVSAFLVPAMDRRVAFAALVLGCLAAWMGLQVRSEWVDGNPVHFWYHFLRYPILLNYQAAIPVFLHSLIPGAGHPEWPYRMLPLLSAAGLAWTGFHALGRRPLPVRAAAAAAVATLPLVRYYSSILYLEMPAVLCMTVVCFQASRLLRADPSSLVRLPAWYALLLVGFIKETTLPFLAAFACCRLAVRLPALRETGRSPGAGDGVRKAWDWKAGFHEARIQFCLALPLSLYLLYRFRFGSPRPYSLQLANLADPDLPLRLSRSLLEGFALLLPLALAGLALMVVRRKRAVPAFLVLTLVLGVAFHYLDDRHFIGYSRFNLFLLPGLLALAWEPLRLGAVRRPALTAACLAAATAVNLRLSPILSDGTKRPFWGVHGEDVGEHYYPYRDALAWLATRHPGEKARLAGLHYGYFSRFYLREGYPLEQVLAEPVDPADEPARLDRLLAAAERDGVQALLYHVPGDFRPPGNAHGYGNMKVFRNRAHALVLFSR